jgi:hypothetical protein
MIGLAGPENGYLSGALDRKLVVNQESGATTSRRKIY